MEKLFSEAGQARLDAIVRAGVLCAFDFDGTLAPLMPKPEQVRLPAPVRDKLEALQGHAPVAIITGRSLEDVRQRLDFAPDYIVGNHGLEGLPGWEQRAPGFEANCRGWTAQLQALLAPFAGELGPGVFLEDKRYSLSVHYRLARSPEQAQARLAQLFAQLQPAPKIVGGKYVFNLLPEEAADKGNALQQLMQASGVSCALYVGDDVTDEDVFRLRLPGVLSVRVEHSDRSAAEFFLERFEDMPQLLDQLLCGLQAMPTRRPPRSGSA